MRGQAAPGDRDETDPRGRDGTYGRRGDPFSEDRTERPNRRPTRSEATSDDESERRSNDPPSSPTRTSRPSGDHEDFDMNLRVRARGPGGTTPTVPRIQLARITNREDFTQFEGVDRGNERWRLKPTSEYGYARELPKNLDSITIGSGEDNDITLRNPGVANYHAILYRETQGTRHYWYLRHVGHEDSATYINRQRILREFEVRIEHEDVIRFGAALARPQGQQFFNTFIATAPANDFPDQLRLPPMAFESNAQGDTETVTVYANRVLEDFMTTHPSVDYDSHNAYLEVRTKFFEGLKDLRLERRLRGVPLNSFRALKLALEDYADRIEPQARPQATRSEGGNRPTRARRGAAPTRDRRTPRYSPPTPPRTDRPREDSPPPSYTPASPPYVPRERAQRPLRRNAARVQDIIQDRERSADRSRGSWADLIYGRQANRARGE